MGVIEEKVMIEQHHEDNDRNIEEHRLNVLASKVLLEHKLPDIFSYRYAFILGYKALGEELKNKMEVIK